MVLKGLPAPSGWLSGMREMLLEASPCRNSRWLESECCSHETPGGGELDVPERKPKQDQWPQAVSVCLSLTTVLFSKVEVLGGSKKMSKVMGTYACRVMPPECAQGSRQTVALQRQHQSGPQRPPRETVSPTPQWAVRSSC